MPDKEAKSGKNRGFFRALAVYGGLGFEVSLAVVIPLLIGMWLDKKFNKEPIFMLILLLLGMAAAINILVRYSRLALKDEKAEPSKDNGENGS